ncbi:MAG: hypothetical protein H6835_20595 [Planctomycetes bacterium]|nr:hypothetical protein [Planctomycetota bacterium]
MDHLPTPDETRALVRPLDELDRKVLGGLVAVWMAEPGRIRDREWTSQQFVQIAIVAHGFDAADAAGAPVGATSEDVERIRSYAQQHMERVVRVGFALFVRVANDLQQRAGGFTYENAQQCLRGYLEVPFGG